MPGHLSAQPFSPPLSALFRQRRELVSQLSLAKSYGCPVGCWPVAHNDRQPEAIGRVAPPLEEVCDVWHAAVDSGSEFEPCGSPLDHAAPHQGMEDGVQPVPVGEDLAEPLLGDPWFAMLAV